MAKTKGKKKEVEQVVDMVEVDLGDGTILQKPDEQEIIEVDQETLKKALMGLLTKENEFLGLLYKKWEDYNREYFKGQLSYPLITIDKLSNKTLGNYTPGTDNMGIERHIRFNRNFIVLNTEERILETLRHEMIHQWQDEVLYAKPGEEPTENQKKRPKDWHNKDFKDYAQIVGIPAKGAQCYGNIAKMPEPQSYNRKFICRCVASNGHRITVWCTRQIHAVCMVCDTPYIEVPKGGKVIQVTQSHVEKPGEDAIEKNMRASYRYFEKFKSKDEKEFFIEEHKGTSTEPITEAQEGTYQKGHNAYKEGYTHWIAYNTAEVVPDEVNNEEVKEIEQEQEKQASEEKPKAPKKPKGTKKVKTEEPKTPKKPKAKIVAVEVKNQRLRSHDNPEDIITLYRELGSMKAVAEHFGKTPATITYQAKRHQIDFNKGVYVRDGELITVE
jgi:hypothetical protein